MYRLFVAILALSLLALVGCQREVGPQLIQVLDVAPREVEVGDRLEIVGNGFPQGKTAKIAFRGKLFRPGEAPESATIDADGAVQSSTQIELVFTEGLKELFCGAGDKSTHTTF